MNSNVEELEEGQTGSSAGEPGERMGEVMIQGSYEERLYIVQKDSGVAIQ